MRNLIRNRIHVPILTKHRCVLDASVSGVTQVIRRRRPKESKVSRRIMYILERHRESIHRS